MPVEPLLLPATRLTGSLYSESTPSYDSASMKSENVMSTGSFGTDYMLLLKIISKGGKRVDSRRASDGSDFPQRPILPTTPNQYFGRFRGTPSRFPSASLSSASLCSVASRRCSATSLHMPPSLLSASALAMAHCLRHGALPQSRRGCNIESRVR
jgi:hypothetical protein